MSRTPGMLQMLTKHWLFLHPGWEVSSVRSGLASASPLGPQSQMQSVLREYLSNRWTDRWVYRVPSSGKTKCFCNLSPPRNILLLQIKSQEWEFPGRPAVKISPSSARDAGSIPGQELRSHDSIAIKQNRSRNDIVTNSSRLLK